MAEARIDLTRELIKSAAEYDTGVHSAKRREDRVREIDHALSLGE